MQVRYQAALHTELTTLQCVLGIAIVGAPGRIRTGDQLVNSQLRYRCATPEHSSNYSDFIYYRQGEN